MNNLEIQRLVDGECTDQQRANLLIAIGDDGLIWRRLALRGLEELTLRRELPNVLSSNLSEPQTNSQQHGLNVAPRRRTFQLVLAASLMFLAIGFWSGRHLSIESPSSSIVAEKADRRGDGESPLPYEDLIPTGRVMLTSADGSASSQEIPVYEVSRIDPRWVMTDDAKHLNEMRAALLQRGWNVAVATEIFEGELPDGRRMIVPVNNVNFEPIGF